MPNSPATDSWTYEAAISEVEAIVTQLETGELPLAEVFERFTQAVQQLKQCDTFLKDKQTQAKLLLETLSDER
ncbi:MAG: exodeoxyribonuclease VII small subunit [Leptolyngbya sp. SIO4C1]|nr:exodeoxyribonuclease VII small subunit [Leptolyngbya sp. SIO4C1]